MMEEVLKKIKIEFLNLVKEKKIKIKHKIHHNMDVLSLIPVDNSRKRKISIDFVLLKNENALDLKLVYSQKKENKDFVETVFSFSSLLKQGTLPMISEEVLPEIKASFNYTVSEGKLKSTISPMTQVQTYIRIIKKDWNSILNYLDTI